MSKIEKAKILFKKGVFLSYADKPEKIISI